MSEWQKIDTAPRDDTEILGFWQYVYYGDSDRTCGQSIISWDKYWWGWREEEFGDKGLYTHWMHLPEPPKEVLNNYNEDNSS